MAPWYPGVYSPVCLPSTLLVYTPCTAQGIPTLLLYLGVPVPPYTVLAVLADDALGSKQGITVGERLPRAS